LSRTDLPRCSTSLPLKFDLHPVMFSSLQPTFRSQEKNEKACANVRGSTQFALFPWRCSIFQEVVRDTSAEKESYDGCRWRINVSSCGPSL
jgi:hypothetical protein